MPRVGGVTNIRVNSQVMPVKDDVEFATGDLINEQMVGRSGIQGHRSEFQVPYVQATLTDRPEIDQKELRTQTSVTITVDLPNGKTFVLRNAVPAGPWATTTTDGEIAARWEGESGELI